MRGAAGVLATDQLALEYRVEVDDGLPYFWHSNNHRELTRLTSRDEAARLFRARNGDDPWVNIMHPLVPVATALEALSVSYAYVQIFTEADDRVLVSGGIDWRSGDWWGWTSAPRGVSRDHTRYELLGPSWYRVPVWPEQPQTIHDALAQLWPALALTHPTHSVVTGYRWDDHDEDPHPVGGNCSRGCHPDDHRDRLRLQR